MHNVLQDIASKGIVPRPGTKQVMTPDTVASAIREVRAGSMDSFGAETYLNANVGIPERFLTLFNTEIIRKMLAPTTAELIVGPAVKRGNFATKTTEFIFGEHSGFVSEYGDYSHDGSVDANFAYPKRDLWQFQTTLLLGDLEGAEWGEAAINMLAEKEMSCAEIMQRVFDKTWFRGVNGLRCYGLHNDPYNPPAIAPVPAGTMNVTEWPDKTGLEIYNDIRALKNALNVQSMGNIPDNAELVLVYSTMRAAELLKLNEHNYSIQDHLKKSFPNLRFVESPEYTTTAGEMVQLICPNPAGRRFADLGFNERMRSHGVVRKESSLQEKKSAGTWGYIGYYPFAIATMIGV